MEESLYKKSTLDSEDYYTLMGTKLKRRSNLLHHIFSLVLVGALTVVLRPAVAAEPKIQFETMSARIDALEKQNTYLLEKLKWVTEQLAERPQPPPPTDDRATLPSDDDPAFPSPHTNNTVTKRAVLPQAPSLLSGLGQMIKPYGFLRLDMAYNDNRSDNGGYIDWVLPKKDQKRSRGEFTIDPRMTRLGLRFNAPDETDTSTVKVKGRLETDFYASGFGGRNEIREKIRMRLAYVKAEGDGWHVTAGQDWDLISPLRPFPSEPNVMWYAGNLGDRRPQFRLAFDPQMGQDHRLTIAGAISRTIGRDVDGDNDDDGKASAIPTFQSRLGYTYYGRGRQSPISIGFWGHYGEEYARLARHGKRGFKSYSVGSDFSVPVSAKLALAGELFWGSNLDAVAGGIGQGINVTTQREIRSIGGWAEARFLVHPALSVAAGYGTDNPYDTDLEVAARARNQVIYLASRFSIGSNITIGAEYAYWRTQYLARGAAALNRIHGYVQYGF